MEKRKTTKSAALDELKKKREEKALKSEEHKKKDEDGKKKWKANDIYSSDSSGDGSKVFKPPKIQFSNDKLSIFFYN